MSQWAPVRSLGCFVYFESSLSEHPDVVEALVGSVLDLDRSLKISTANNALRWRKYASTIQLRAAGAVDIEHVNGSLIFGTGTPMLEAWDPQYLEATRALRRLLWPIMAQNPADDPDAPRGRGGRERRR